VELVAVTCGQLWVRKMGLSEVPNERGFVHNGPGLPLRTGVTPSTSNPHVGIAVRMEQKGQENQVIPNVIHKHHPHLGMIWDNDDLCEEL